MMDSSYFHLRLLDCKWLLLRNLLGKTFRAFLLSLRIALQGGHLNIRYMKAVKYSALIIQLVLVITNLLTGTPLQALAVLPELLEKWRNLHNLNISPSAYFSLSNTFLSTCMPEMYNLNDLL